MKSWRKSVATLCCYFLLFPRYKTAGVEICLASKLLANLAAEKSGIVESIHFIWSKRNRWPALARVKDIAQIGRSKLSMKLLLLITVAASPALGGILDSSKSSTYPDEKPELGKYQDFSKCFPLKETWYLVYQNMPIEARLLPAARCYKVSQRGPMENFTIPMDLYLARNHWNATLTLKSTEGYEAKNVLEYRIAGAHMRTNIAYVDCGTCKVLRHPHIKPGPACSVIVPESQLGKPTVCDFIFDLLCGTSPKYEIYEEGCKEKR